MIYEYVCRACNRHFEVWATLAEKESGLRAVCPACGSDKSRQVIAAFTIGGRTRGSSSLGCGCEPGQC